MSSKKNSRIAARKKPLADFQKAYLDGRRKYDQATEVTMRLSLNQQGINTDGRGVRAVRLFTRQTLVAMTLKRILPDPPGDFHAEASLWDLCSVASLCRNLVEGYVYLRYFGTEKVTPEDAELRFVLGQFHRNNEWYNIRKKTDKNDPVLREFEAGLREQEERLNNHPYIKELTAPQRNRVRLRHEMYKTKADFEVEESVCVSLRRDFQLLSNQVHPLPLSIERIDNERGRGIGNEADVNWCLLSMSLATRYLAASTVSIADYFPVQLGEPFKEELDQIRPFLELF